MTPNNIPFFWGDGNVYDIYKKYIIALMIYNVYKRLESIIETFDARDKSLTWDPLFVASGACWTEFAELRGKKTLK